jgi:hypothetical protein
MPDAVALPASDGEALIKFQEIGELLEAVLAIDECLRFFAQKAAERANPPFMLPQSPSVAPRIQIMPEVPGSRTTSYMMRYCRRSRARSGTPVNHTDRMLAD